MTLGDSDPPMAPHETRDAACVGVELPLDVRQFVAEEVQDRVSMSDWDDDRDGHDERDEE